MNLFSLKKLYVLNIDKKNAEKKLLENIYLPNDDYLKCFSGGFNSKKNRYEVDLTDYRGRGFDMINLSIEFIENETSYPAYCKVNLKVEISPFVILLNIAFFIFSYITFNKISFLVMLPFILITLTFFIVKFFKSNQEFETVFKENIV